MKKNNNGDYFIRRSADDKYLRLFKTITVIKNPPKNV